jgi:uncharacterized protein YyaL (SSP411 family)
MGLLSDTTSTSNNEYFAQALAIWSHWSEKAIHDAKDADKPELLEVTKILGNPLHHSLI